MKALLSSLLVLLSINSAYSTVVEMTGTSSFETEDKECTIAYEVNDKKELTKLYLYGPTDTYEVLHETGGEYGKRSTIVERNTIEDYQDIVYEMGKSLFSKNLKGKFTIFKLGTHFKTEVEIEGELENPKSLNFTSIFRLLGVVKLGSEKFNCQNLQLK